MPIQEQGQAARLYTGAPGTVSSILYTANSAAYRTVIREIMLANTGSVAAVVTLNLNGTLATGYPGGSLVPNQSILASTLTVVSCNVPLNNGDTISGVNGTANAIQVTISGELVA